VLSRPSARKTACSVVGDGAARRRESRILRRRVLRLGHKSAPTFNIDRRLSTVWLMVYTAN
jgi:hypothetical protein